MSRYAKKPDGFPMPRDDQWLYFGEDEGSGQCWCVGYEGECRDHRDVVNGIEHEGDKARWFDVVLAPIDRIAACVNALEGKDPAKLAALLEACASMVSAGTDLCEAQEQLDAAYRAFMEGETK